MFEFLKSPLWNSVFLFIALATTLYLWKPELMFEDKTNMHKMRSFGVKKGETLFTFSVVTFAAAIGFYFMFTLLTSLT